MIVKCEQCQTRFKIPDEKVTEKGVRVRCSKCQSTFRVRRLPLEATVQLSEDDPFALFGHQDSGGDPGGATRPYPATDWPVAGPDEGAEVVRPPSAAPSPPPKVPPLARLPSAPAQAPTMGGEDDPFGFLSEASSATGLDSQSLTAVAPAVASNAADPLASGALTAVAPASALIANAADPLASGALTAVAPASALIANAADPLASGAMTVVAPAAAQGAGDPFDSQAMTAAAPGPAKPPATVLGRVPVVRAGTAVPEASVGVRTRVKESAPSGALAWIGGTVVNLTLSAALLLATCAAALAYFAEGRLDGSAFSAERLRAIVTASRDTMVTAEVTRGLYETGAGRPVLFVLGRVENRGAVGGRAKVRAELLEGEVLLRAAEGYAGGVASPEQVFGLAGAAEVEALNSKTAAAAVEIAPGAGAPFLLVFDEYPRDLASFRVRVSAFEERARETAKR